MVRVITRWFAAEFFVDEFVNALLEVVNFEVES